MQDGLRRSNEWIGSEVVGVETATTQNFTTASGTNIYATTDIQKAGRSLGALGTGSPTTWGYSEQHGTVTATNVAVWAVFGTAFTGSAVVSLTLNESGAATAYGGAVVEAGPGSFSMLGTSGLEYTYSAKGI